LYSSQTDLNALRKEQDKLLQERQDLQKTKEEKKAARMRRDSGGSFSDRLKQRSDQKKLEAAQNRKKEEKE
jgi:hypothetical protein